MQCREAQLLPQQRLLELKRVRLDLQAAEDSNDSGLSSEHSANSSQDRSILYQQDFQPHIAHFAKEYIQDQYPNPRLPMMATNAADKLRHRDQYGHNLVSSKSSRRLPRSPSVENQNMSLHVDEALSQLKVAPSIFRQKACSGVDQDEAFYNNFNSFNRVQRHLDCSSDSELHQTPLDYASRRRSGDIYSSATSASHRSFQQQQAQAEANSIYWSQKLHSLNLQQEDVTRHPAATTSSTFSVSGQPSHRNLQRQRSYDLQTDEPYLEQPSNGNGDYSGWMSERADEYLYSFPEKISTTAAQHAMPNYSGRRAIDHFPINSKTDPYMAAATNPLGNLTTKKDVLAMRGIQKFNVKDWERARFAAKYNKEDFRLYNHATSNNCANSPGWLSKSVDGLVYIHVIAGVGLHSSQALVRDFYCVLETDKVRKARTMIRTSTECFEWDELFDLDLNCTRNLAFSLYQWDSRSKHRLCYYASLDLVTLLDGFRQRFVRSEKLILKLQPKGLLYLEISYLEVGELYQRLPALRPGSYFGAPLDTVVRRDGGGLGIPLLVQSCLIEVEKRGLDIVGIYRLSASTRCRQQLREAFEQQPHEVDLSSEKVSDVHIVTGLLRDYLRALPEPLFTNSLYRMVLDAMHVSLPGDPRGVAKLMLSILDCLPPPNQNTLLALLDHLKKVVLKSETNRMNTAALAMSFGPVLLYPSSTAARNLDSSLLHLDRMTEVLKYLLDIWTSNRSDQRDSNNESNYELSLEARNKANDSSFESPLQSLSFRGRQKSNRPISDPASQELRRSSFHEQDNKINSGGSSSARQFHSQLLRTSSQEGRSLRVKHIVC